MDSRCTNSWEDVKNIHMDLKHLQAIQLNHSDRLLKLEKRQADDAALKSVWSSSSAFPNVLSGIPQQDPLPSVHDDVFDKFDGDQGQNILKSLQLEDDEEPVRRGASRANSVRFDVTVSHNTNWSVPARNSGDFVSVRPSSGFGNNSTIERSLSHKSDGRQSSAGHSLPDFFSLASGRTSSLGLDTNFEIGDVHDKDSSNESVPYPAPGIFILGSVPAIIRCWLTTNFCHNSLLYATVCSGSQRSIIHYNLVKDLGLQDIVHKDHTGRNIIKLSLYLPEAIIIHPVPRLNSLGPQLPALSANFEIIGMNQQNSQKKSIYIFLGSDTLRSHNADILFSQNLMTAYGDDKSRISIPFVRPEDDEIFKNLCVTHLPPERVGLKATATPFTPLDSKLRIDPIPTDLKKKEDRTFDSNSDSVNEDLKSVTEEKPLSTSSKSSDSYRRSSSVKSINTALAESRHDEGSCGADSNLKIKPEAEINLFDTSPRRSSVIWGPWRQESCKNWSQSGYQPPKRGGSRSMKILKPSYKLNSASSVKSTSSMNHENSSWSSSTIRTISSNESPPLTATFPAFASSNGQLRKKRNSLNDGGSSRRDNVIGRWGNSPKNSIEELKKSKNTNGNSTSTNFSIDTSSNPIGGASAFAWMNSGKTKGIIAETTPNSTATTIVNGEGG